MKCDGASTRLCPFALGDTRDGGSGLWLTDIAIDRKDPGGLHQRASCPNPGRAGTVQDSALGVEHHARRVYAAQQVEGDGDARVTIRGFDQTNLAVMVDGVPMNDMETGQVYWSNWILGWIWRW